MRSKFLAMSLLSVFLISVLMTQASAAEVTNTKIGVVDIQRVVNASKVAKDVQVQLDQKRKSVQTQMAQQEKDLRALEQVLKTQRNSMSAEVFAKKQDDFKANLRAAQKNFAKNRLAWEKASDKSFKTIRNEAAKVIGDIASEQGYAMVVAKDSVVLAEKSLDLTELALRNLDKKMTKLVVQW